MKRNIRKIKYSPIVEEVDLIDTNLQYAYVCLQYSREAILSTKQLAPTGSCPSENVDKMNQPHIPKID